MYHGTLIDGYYFIKFIMAKRKHQPRNRHEPGFTLRSWSWYTDFAEERHDKRPHAWSVNWNQDPLMNKEQRQIKWKIIQRKEIWNIQDTLSRKSHSKHVQQDFESARKKNHKKTSIHSARTTTAFSAWCVIMWGFFFQNDWLKMYSRGLVSVILVH